MFASQAIYLPEGKWNAVNEPAISSLQSDAVQSRWLGNLGRAWYADDIAAGKNSDTSVGTLRVGVYALVQTKSGSTAAPARGKACFFASASDMASYIVTPDGGATLDGRMAGVYISAPTKGYYCVIQICGLCTVLYTSSVTATDGTLVTLVSTSNVFDSYADGDTINTAGGNSGLKVVKGIAFEAPANDALKLAYIDPNFAWIYKL